MNKSILRLAIPNIISNLTVPLLSFVDIALMGHLDSEVYIGAIALGGIIFNYIFWSLGFLRMGTTGFTAQAYGRENWEEVFLILIRALGVAILAASVLLILQYPIAELSFLLIEGSPEVEAEARSYFYARIYAAPATVSLYALMGWFLGIQNARIPMFTAILINVANIGFSFWFVVGLGYSASGVAWGTVLAQYLGCFFALSIFLSRYKTLWKYWSLEAILQRKALLEFFRVNQDIFIRTLVLVFAFSFFYAQSAAYGDTLLAVNSILLQFNMMLAFGIDGFAFAAESLVGKYLGARDQSALKKVIQYIFYWGMALALVFTLVYSLGGDSIMHLLTKHEEVIALAQHYQFWILIAPVIHSVCFIWDGIYIGATASRAMRNSTFIATFGAYLPVYYLSADYLENHALWLAMTVFMMARGLVLSLWAKRMIYAKAQGSILKRSDF